MKVLVEMTFQDYMDMYPSKDVRLIEESEVNKIIPELIDHMNETWSGGRYDKRYSILTIDEIKDRASKGYFSKEGLEQIANELNIEL